MRHFTRALVVVAFLSGGLHAQSLPTVTRAGRVIDSHAQAFVAGGFSPSVAVAVVRGRDTITMKAWGSADLELGVPATANSVYRIGSVTKQFTASAVMQLVEQQKVKLDDSIATYLSTLPAAWHRVTVRQLLNHTSGIPSYTDLGPRWLRRFGEEMTPDTLVALTAAEPMWFEPGTNWRYDNTGYVVLGMLIERVTGHSWETDLNERFFKPLGLSETRNCLTTPLIPRRARGYEKEGGQWENTVYLAMSQPFSAGALCSTIGDLVRWNRALHTGHVVSAGSYAQMTTPEGAASHAALRYGFGLAADTLAGAPVITHGGGIPGFSTGNIWVPSAQLSVTVLTNSGSAPAGRLLKQVVRAALGAPLEQSAPAIPLPAADRKKYVGVYALALPDGAKDLTIAEEDDHLTARIAGQGANLLQYLGNHTFGMSFDPELRLVFTVDGASASKVTLREGGALFEAKRK